MLIAPKFSLVTVLVDGVSAIMNSEEARELRNKHSNIKIQRLRKNKKVGHPDRQFLHAEIACLIRCKDQPIHKLLVWRYGRDGQLVCAKPCAICKEAIKAFSPTEVWYSDYGTMVKL